MRAQLAGCGSRLAEAPKWFVWCAGLAGEQNVQGEDQKKLDVISNEVFSNCLRGR